MQLTFSGALSFVIGLGWILFMPNEPHTAKFFDDHEKRLATRRVAENMMGTTGASASTWKNYQVWHALKDPLTWFVWIYMFVCMVSPSFAAGRFAPVWFSLTPGAQWRSHRVQHPGHP